MDELQTKQIITPHSLHSVNCIGKSWMRRGNKKNQWHGCLRTANSNKCQGMAEIYPGPIVSRRISSSPASIIRTLAKHREVPHREVRKAIKAIYNRRTQYTPGPHTHTHTHTHTLAHASIRGQAMLDLVPRATSRTVDQTPAPPFEREGAGAFTMWVNTAWSTLGARLVNRYMESRGRMVRTRWVRDPHWTHEAKQ